MDKRWRTLILDTDPDTRIILQQILGQADMDVRATWNEIEAWQLIGTTPFDLILIGDHPPELNAAAILDNLSLRGICPPVLVLRGIFGEKDAEYFHRLGATAVVPKRDPRAVLEQITKALAPVQFKPRAANAGLTETPAWRVAS